MPVTGPFDQICERCHRERNHQGLGIETIESDIGSDIGSNGIAEVNCRERLGGLLRYHYRDAA